MRTILITLFVTSAIAANSQGQQASQSADPILFEYTGLKHLELNHARAGPHRAQPHERSRPAVIPPEIAKLFEYSRSGPADIQALCRRS